MYKQRGSDAQKQQQQQQLQQKEGELLLAVDEHPRPDVALEKMAKLPTVFRKERGRVTAATASMRPAASPSHSSAQRANPLATHDGPDCARSA